MLFLQRGILLSGITYKAYKDKRGDEYGCVLTALFA